MDENVGCENRKKRIIDNQSRMEGKKGRAEDAVYDALSRKDIRRRRRRRRRRRHVFAPAVKTRRAAEY